MDREATEVTVRDVTLREFGQNVPADRLGGFTVEQRLWLARRLIDVGVETMEIASTASPKVAPAMDGALVQRLARGLGRPEGVELITLVPPSPRAFARFFDLGLDQLGHSMGVFLSAPDEHNLANLGRRTEETLTTLEGLLPVAADRGVRVVGYVTAAFGYRPTPGSAVIEVPAAEVRRLARQLVQLGAVSVTLSDLQGLAGPDETAALLSELTGDGELTIGYHPHHSSTEAVLANVEAAAAAGVRLFDASLGAVGGCVTGAPGNGPTEGMVRRLESIGLHTGLDPEELDRLAIRAGRVVFDRVTTGS